MIAPRRLQLRRGNTAAVSSYLGAVGELIVNTDNNTLYIHDGVTVGGHATTVNVALINNQISLVNANITQANVGMQGYVDFSIRANIANIAPGYTNTNVKSYLGAFDGNIIPSANVTYSLGNITHQWRDLFVSNNTIYVGGVPLSIDATGNLTINGNTIPTIGYVNTAVANVQVDLTAYALNANVTAANVGLKGYVDQGNTIQSAQIASANVGMKGYVDQANTIQLQQISSANIGMKGYVDYSIANISIPTTYSNANVTSYLPTYSGNIGANITKGSYTWTFGTNGTTTFPNGLTVESDAPDTLIATATGDLILQGSDDVEVRGRDDVFITSADQAHIWTFNSEGNLTFPDSTTQTTAFSNTAIQTYLASPTLHTLGDSVIVTGNLTVQGNLFLNGNTTILNTNNLVISDNIIYFANANPANSLDIGISGHFTANGVYQHTGLIRQASSNSWKLFSNIASEPSGTIDFTNAVYDDLQLGNITSPTIDGINANAQAQQTLISSLQSNSSSQQSEIYSLQSNATAQQTTLNTLLANAATQSDLINAINANVTQANVGLKGYVDFANTVMKAYVDGQIIAANANVSSSGGTNYSNVNVAAYLSTATINTTGNITAQYISGNISITGNVTGTSPNVTIQAGAYTSVFDNQGNVRLPSAYVSGNVSANYFVGNGALLTGIVAGSNYSNVDVANYLPTYSGNIANITLGPSGILTFADGTTQITAGGGSYSNVQVAAYLPTYDGTVSASLVNSSGNILSTGLSVFGNTRIGRTGAVSGQFHTVVGNIVQTSSGGAVYINTTGNVLAAAVVAGAVTSTGTVAVNAATGITTNQATFLLANATATTINIGGAATTIRMGTNTSNVFVGRAIGNANRELLLRAQGTWNTAINFDSNGGFNSPPYTNQPVIGGSGTGMTANYNATGGYLTSVTIYNPGTGYQNGDVLSVPGGIAGNSFTLTNYSSTLTGNSSAAYTFGIEGNLTVPGNVTARNFIGTIATASQPNITAVGTLGTLNVTGNATVGNLVGVEANTRIISGNYTTTFDIYGNVTMPGNVIAPYFIGGGSLLSGVATKTTGSWTVTAGTNNYSFTVPANNSYQLWVRGNIPNGIIVYNATVSVSNTNVPVIGQQFAWNYEGAGNPILLTSIPAQIIGTAGTISNANPSVGTTTNEFVFGISNTSGSSQVVYWGYVTL